MKRLLSILVTLLTLLSLASCKREQTAPVAEEAPAVPVAESAKDTDPVTMLIGMGNNESYFSALLDMVKADLGIEIELVYRMNRDTTDMIRLYAANDDLPADIVFAASKTQDSLLKGCCLDLLGDSSLASLFTPMVIQSCTTQDGVVYQLPLTSRLIGITYNETLLREMGWEVPGTFADMVALKAKCDEAGVKFAVYDSFATGHGFNWLFHMMGAQYLSTPDGTAWLTGFQDGTRTVEEFKEKCEYFKKWNEAGLFGTRHDQDWSGGSEFQRTRALFWYGLTNSLTGYDGPQYDEAGNETGITLHDTYKSMPWISEDGSNNTYTAYDSCWAFANKSLQASDRTKKRENVYRILEYMASDKAVKLVTDMGKDTYVAVKKQEMDTDRLYAAYSKSITNGFVQPWYYNSFDMDSIVFTGEKINAYLGGTSSFEAIFETLDECNQNHLNADIQVLATFPEALNTESTARLAAIACAMALDKTLEENGRAERAEVTIVPYATADNPMQPWRSASVSTSVVYPGDFDASQILTLLAPDAVNPVGIRMTGKEIKQLTEKGFDPSDRYVDAATGKSTFDAQRYGPYPYVVLVKGGAALEDDREYLVALCSGYIPLASYNAFKSGGSELTGLENAHPVEDGLRLFAAQHPTIAVADLVW